MLFERCTVSSMLESTVREAFAMEYLCPVCSVYMGAFVFAIRSYIRGMFVKGEESTNLLFLVLVQLDLKKYKVPHLEHFPQKS